MFKGDWIKQDRGDEQCYGLLVEKLKNGGFKAVVFDTGYPKAVIKSTTHWHPRPEVINATQVPDYIIKKISGKMFTLKGRVS